MKNSLHAKVKILDIQDWESLIAVLNKNDAWEFGINQFDKIQLQHHKEKLVVDADLSKHMIESWQVWIFQEIAEKMNLKDWDVLHIQFTERSLESAQAIRKKMQWKPISESEINAIIKDISENKLTDTLITYYVASSFFQETTDKEAYLTAKAMAENGVTFKYPKGDIVADKHCIGWVPGNETTMIMIPLLASLWIKMPKNFSKAITSPAATWECVSVLMNTEFEKKWIEEIIKKVNSCLIWWGGLDLAPSDDRIIRVSYPLSMQNISKVVSSIMAKKYAMWITHSLIDIPVWPTAKVKNDKEAKIWIKKFESIGTKLWMKMTVQATKADQPIWAWIWWVLQVREVLRVLQQHENRPLDLEEKAVFLSSKIIEIVGLAKGKEAYKLAYWQLISWEAWKMMQEIIKVQAYEWWTTKYFKWWKAWDVKSEELELAKYSHEFKVDKDWTVKDIDMKELNMMTRSLGAPHDLQAGFYLNKKVWDTFKKWDTLCTLYANQESKINIVLTKIQSDNFYKF